MPVPLRFLISGWLALLLVSACSTDAAPPDAGPEDADAGGDVDPCEAALLQWTEVWQVSTDQSGLEGITPDINLMDVWGSGPDDIYAVGFKGIILHNDGGGWSQMESGTEDTLEGVWGYVLKDEQGQVTLTDVFAAGSNGTILRLRFKPTDANPAWQLQRVISDPEENDPQPVTGNFHDVWGVRAPGPNDDQHPVVMAVGSAGLIVQFDSEATEFKEMLREETFEYSCDAGTCSRTEWKTWTSERLGGVYGTAADFFVAVGDLGVILEYNGSAWSPGSRPTGFVTHLNGVWGRHANEIFAVGNEGTIMLRSGGGGWEDLKALAAGQGGHINVSTTYLRNSWAFYQSKCGEVPDGGTEAQDTSWGFFIGWDNRMYLFHDRTICPFSELDVRRFEGIWGTAPRSEEDRTREDGGIECDPVDVVITGVNGTIIRLRNPEGR